MKDFEGFIKNYATRDFIYFFAEKSIEIYKNQVAQMSRSWIPWSLRSVFVWHHRVPQCGILFFRFLLL